MQSQYHLCQTKIQTQRASARPTEPLYKELLNLDNLLVLHIEASVSVFHGLIGNFLEHIFMLAYKEGIRLEKSICLTAFAIFKSSLLEATTLIKSDCPRISEWLTL